MGLPSPFVPLLYHNLGDLSRGFLKKFRTFFIISTTRHFSGLFPVPGHEPNRTLKGLSKRDKVQWLLVINPLLFLVSTVLGAFAAEVPLLTPLLYHNLGDLSRGFWYIFFRVYRNPYYPPKRFVSSSLSP